MVTLATKYFFKNKSILLSSVALILIFINKLITTLSFSDKKFF